MLQTAIISVKKEGGNYSNYRALLESGSQRSYIIQKVAKELKLDTEEQNNLTVFTFGSKISHEIESSLVKLIIKVQNNKTKTLYVNVVPIISEGIPCSQHELNTRICQEIYELADDGSFKDRIDILIGNDYYFSLMSNERRKRCNQIFMVKRYKSTSK